MSSRRITLGEDWVFSTILRDSSGSAKDLSSSGANITLYAYGGQSDVYTATLTVTPATGTVSATLPASGLYNKLKPGLYRYQVKLNQGGAVTVGEAGLVTVLGGSLGPDPSVDVGSSTLAVQITGNANVITDPSLQTGVYEFGGQPLVATVTGGVPPYSYAWSLPDDTVAILAAPNSSTTRVLYPYQEADGDYTQTVTLVVFDSLGNSVTGTTSITNTVVGV